jgi:hypothetical protein
MRGGNVDMGDREGYHSRKPTFPVLSLSPCFVLIPFARRLIYLRHCCNNAFRPVLTSYFLVSLFATLLHLPAGFVVSFVSFVENIRSFVG